MTPGDQLIGRAFVAGVPVPQGDLSAAPAKGRQRFASLFHANAAKLKPWRRTIAWEAKRQAPECFLAGDAPLLLVARFHFPRTKKLAGVVAVSAREATKRADVDKLARAVLDALTGVWFADDGQVVDLVVSKRIAELGQDVGVELELWRIVEAGDVQAGPIRVRKAVQGRLLEEEAPAF